MASPGCGSSNSRAGALSCVDFSRVGPFEWKPGITVHLRHPNLTERALQEELASTYVDQDSATLAFFDTQPLDYINGNQSKPVFPSEKPEHGRNCLVRSDMNDREQADTKIRYKELILSTRHQRPQGSAFSASIHAETNSL